MLALLIKLLIDRFGWPVRWDFGFLGHIRVFPALFFIGLAQNLGTWIDKFVFWTSDLSVDASGLVTAPKYDSSLFLGFLTAMPAVVHFFVRIEADISRHFHRYYDEVFFRSSFDRIELAGAKLRAAVKKAFLDILKVQGVITFLCSAVGVEILDMLGLPVSQVGMFRFGVVGSLFLVFMMFANVILLYLDRQREVLISASVFLIVNVALSIASLRLGYQFYGLGFAAACLIGFLTSLFHLANQLYNLEYMTFAMRPVVGQRRATAALRASPGGRYGRYNPLPSRRAG